MAEAGVSRSSGRRGSASFADPTQAVSALVAGQNSDGGWGYRSTESWTEPTAFALVALRAYGNQSTAVERGLRWLTQCQRRDGGWPPNPQVEESTWVTALALLALGENPRALAWLIEQSGRESGIVHRLRLWMLGFDGGVEMKNRGWPWFPGAAAWVAPTALTIVAMNGYGTPEARKRLATAREFLLSRMCSDGGWNHGSSRALGYESSSYPETTGLALLALRGTPNLSRSIERAQNHLRECRSTQGACWLRLGLLAHDQPAAMKDLPCRNQLDTALYLLASIAGRGRNPLLDN